MEIDPTSRQEELAVHVRKVEDVRRWFTEAFGGVPMGKLKKYRVREHKTFTNHR
jgi:cell cycle checkpoint protein